MNSKLCLMFIVSACCISAFGQESRTKQPVPIIFDTDMGNDVDDVLALGLIHSLESLGECKLLAVTVTKDNKLAAPFVDAVNTFYGRGDVPVGMVRGGVTPDDGLYLRPMLEAVDNGKPRFPRKLEDGRDAPDAVSLLRKTLAAQPDGAVVIVQVGFSTNLARLLDSKPDDASPLDGTALVKQKVRLLSAMAGRFANDGRHFCEFNVAQDVKSAQQLFSRWPTPVVFSGFEVGMAIVYPRGNLKQDYSYAAHHPLAESHQYYKGHNPNGQPTWDLTSVLYVVRSEAGYFDLSAAGRVIVDGDGSTQFKPEANGPHRYLIVTPEQAARVLNEFKKLCSRPPIEGQNKNATRPTNGRPDLWAKVRITVALLT